MAFTRNFLKSLSLTDEQVSAIMEEHTSVTDFLKGQTKKAEDEAKGLKVEADKVSGLEQKIKDLEGGEDYKTKFENEHKAFEDFKKELATKEETAKIEKAYRQLLTDERISDKRHDAIVRVTDFSAMKLDKEGKLENLEKLKEEIGKEWGEFKVTTHQRTQRVETPPDGGAGGGGESRARELYLNHMKQKGIKVDDAGKD